MMGFQVENLILNNSTTLIQKIGIPFQDIIAANPYIQRQTKQHQGCQIDYLIQTKSNNLIVCEFKFRKNEINSSVIGDVQEKVKSLSLPKGVGVANVLVHIGDISESVLQKQYFYRILNLSDWLRES